MVGEHLGMDRWLLELIGQRRQHAAVRGPHRTVGQRIGRQGGGRHRAGESQQQDEGEACVTGHPGRVTSLGSVARMRSRVTASVLTLPISTPPNHGTDGPVGAQRDAMPSDVPNVPRGRQPPETSVTTLEARSQ